MARAFPRTRSSNAVVMRESRNSRRSRLLYRKVQFHAFHQTGLQSSVLSGTSSAAMCRTRANAASFPLDRAAKSNPSLQARPAPHRCECPRPQRSLHAPAARWQRRDRRAGRSRRASQPDGTTETPVLPQARRHRSMEVFGDGDVAQESPPSSHSVAVCSQAALHRRTGDPCRECRAHTCRAVLPPTRYGARTCTRHGEGWHGPYAHAR